MTVVLYNIRSLHNVGSIFRTADAMGVEKIYLCGITPKPVDEFKRPREQLTKVSLGAEKYIPWEKVYSASRLLDKLKKENYRILALEQHPKSVKLQKIKKSNKFVLVLGNEVKGLPESILKRADKVVEIPMLGQKESLNVAVAFGIAAYHFTL